VQVINAGRHDRGGPGALQRVRQADGLQQAEERQERHLIAGLDA